MAAIAGLRGTGDWGTDERPKNFREMILWLQPNGSAPITALMSKMGKGSTDDPEFAWWEETLSILRLTLDDADDMNSTDVDVVVDSGANDLNVGDLLMVETTITNTFANEIVRVTGRTSDTQFTISRGQAGTTAASIIDNDGLLAIGTSFEEGSTSPNSSTRNPSKFLNYCQIFKKSYELTNTTAKTSSRTGDPKKNDKRRRMFDHARDIELATIFGQRNETASGPVTGKPIRQMGGFLYYLAAKSPSRIKIRSGAYTTMKNWLDDTFDVFDFTGDGNTGGDTRLVFAGNGALNILNKMAFADGTINYGDTVTQWGMNFTKFIMPQGTMMFKSHPLLNQHTTFTNMALIIDPPGIRWRPLRDTKFEDEIQANDADTTKGQWITEAGVEYNHLETMKAVLNITF